MTPDTTIVFSTHAERRLHERGIERGLCEAILRKPLAQGHLPRKAGEAEARYATAQAILGQSHTWVTVVYAQSNGVALVLTAYPGTPTRVRNARLSESA